MSDNSSGGFGAGIVLGALVGLVAGVYLASGPAREEVARLRQRTVELTSNPEEMKERARSVVEGAREAVRGPEAQVRRAIRDGVSAARRRRSTLKAEAEESGGDV